MRILLPIMILAVGMACSQADEAPAQSSTPDIAPEEGYQLPVFSEREMWERSSYLFTVSFGLYLGETMNRGLSPSESGQHTAEMLASGWGGADTPVALFNGMYRNWSLVPGNNCDVSEATDLVVRAVCNRPYLAYFEQSGGEIYGMSADEYEESNESFNTAIAASVGLGWDQELQGDNFSITISKN
jgi:hypothetical protein|tara:strand:- start:405 stop:962 length:558 start_codon:yes stop_codon:yes gene_type:complete